MNRAAVQAVHLLKLLLPDVSAHHIPLQHYHLFSQHDSGNPQKSRLRALDPVQGKGLFHQSPKNRLLQKILPHPKAQPGSVDRQQEGRTGIKVQEFWQIIDLLLKILVDTGKYRQIAVKKAAPLPVNLRKSIHKRISLLIHPHLPHGKVSRSLDFQHQIKVSSLELIQEHILLVGKL